MTDTAVPDTDTGPVRALDILLEECWPRAAGTPAKWHWKPCAITRDVRVPSWNWQRRGIKQYDPNELVTLDCNGAYLAPLSGVVLASSGLQHTGAMRSDTKMPGFYQVDGHKWTNDQIVSPLGMGTIGSRVWISQPTLEILQMLERAKHQAWPDIRIYDSWTAAPDPKGNITTVKLQEWAVRLRELRAEAKDDPVHYKAVKDAYGAAYNMMLGNDKGEKVKSRLRRPDWNKHLLAAHSANMWRKAWRSIEAGAAVLAMGSVDELTYHHQDVEHLMRLAEQPKGAPLKFDPTGLQLGAFKVKIKGDK